MPDQCNVCGRVIDGRDVRHWRGLLYCDSCLANADPSYAPSPESLLSSHQAEFRPVTRPNVPGANVSSALKIFAYVSMVGGLALGLLSAERGASTLIIMIAGIFWGVMLLGFATVIDLLRLMYMGSMK